MADDKLRPLHIAESQTAQPLGGNGAVVDFIVGLLVLPKSLSPGGVTLFNGATSMTLFAGGANSVSTLMPFFVLLNLQCVRGGWMVSTGVDVNVVAVGNFT